MNEFIVNLNTKINPTKYITGSCAAYAAVLCEEAERRCLPWDFVVILRTDLPENPTEYLASHVMALIDDRFYDVTGQNDPDHWIADLNKDLEVILGDSIQWKQDFWRGINPIAVLSRISAKYPFDHEQLSAYKELSKIANEVHDATLPQDNLQ